MKYFAFFLVICLPVLTGCNDAPESQTQAAEAPKSEAVAAVSPAAGFSGEVMETLDGGPYTYAKVKAETGEYWAAAPKMALKAGDEVIVPAGTLMKEFNSKTLNRTFTEVVFVETIMVAGVPIQQAQAGLPSGHPPVGNSMEQQMPAGHPPLGEKNPANIGGLPGLQEIAVPEIPEIPKAEGGYTVAELFAQKEALAGKEVSVRGMVVKFNPQIMNTNWLHIQDGSGEKGTNDLTITSPQTVDVGKVAVVTGKLSVDKDFGYGYKYSLILEDAQLVVE